MSKDPTGKCLAKMSLNRLGYIIGPRSGVREAKAVISSLGFYPREGRDVPIQRARQGHN